MSAEPRYRMRLSLNVLQHLGLNLYSNVPAVLSEVVANAWDADARKVGIELDQPKDRIVIQDDGVGMTVEDINSRFLLVGYRRRDKQPGPTPKGRPPMGRKGIGKLSLFSVADEIVVETARDGQKCALRLSLEKIREEIEEQSSKNGSGEYCPEVVSTDSVDFDQGTRITLSGLRKRQTISTVNGLRKRIVRRFSIIGPSYSFEIFVNGSQVSPSDRGYDDRLQYMWTYDDQSAAANCRRLVKESPRSSTIEVPGAARNLAVRGWLGTVHQSKQLRDEGGQNLNRIAIFMRGKMAQEDILSDLTERGVYAGYLIGQLEVDGLDTDDGSDSNRDEDAATSSRQRIVEDDPRYVALRKFVKKELSHIERCWSKLREQDGVRIATMIPQIKAWIDELSQRDASLAKSWLGKINRISVVDEKERRNLFKHAVIAFEFYRLNQNVDELEKIQQNDIESAIATFRKLDQVEASLYGQIVRNRIEVIKALQAKIDSNQKERVIQEYVFEHLWLLDPSWERTDTEKLMEVRVGNLFEAIESNLSEEEKNARLDIQYREAAGKHIVVELKRPSRAVSVYDLGKQIGKYRSGIMKILSQQNKPHEPFEFICLLGKDPVEISEPGGRDFVAKLLQSMNARYMHYDELLDRAYRSYSEYLRKAKDLDRLGNLIKSIENYSN